VAVCDRNAESGWVADQLVEWNNVGALSYSGIRAAAGESEWDLVSEWKPLVAVFDSGPAWEPVVPEREWSAGFGVIQWEVFNYDELAGNRDPRDYLARWNADQLGQRYLLGEVSALYAVMYGADRTIGAARRSHFLQCESGRR
jgi:hypothetical protein